MNSFKKNLTKSLGGTHGKKIRYHLHYFFLGFAQRDIEKELEEKANEIDVLASKLVDERKISKDLSTAKLQKLLETTHKQLQKEREKNKALSLQVRCRKKTP